VSEPSGLYYPNRLARAFFMAMDDVMGQHGLNAILTTARLERYMQQPPPDNLERAFDFADMAAMSVAMEEIYGVRGGRGMALRIGRAAFAKGLKRFGVMRGLGDPAFRALPLAQRVNYGLQALAAVFTHFSDQQATLHEEPDAYLFEVINSPMAIGRTADKPVCHAQVGILQEALLWASNGYVFLVREVACQAMGAEACVFRINKSAIGEGSTI